MLKKIVCIAFFFGSFSMLGQDYYAKFIDLFQNHYEAGAIKNLLDEWNEKSPNDVQYYVAGFNFYFNESKQELVHLDSNPGDKENLVLKDSLNATAGYMYSQTTYNDSVFSISQKFLIDGIAKFPKRLDLRFGRIFALGEAKKFDVFTDEILEVIKISKATDLDWIWQDNKPLDDKVNFFKNAIQDYQNTLYNEKEDANMMKIAVAMVAYFPNDEIVLSTLGSCYLLDNKPSEALPIFLKANAINSDDTIILNNLGETYLKLNDTVTAKSYFQKMIEIGDEETKKYAEAKLKSIP